MRESADRKHSQVLASVEHARFSTLAHSGKFCSRSLNLISISTKQKSFLPNVCRFCCFHLSQTHTSFPTPPPPPPKEHDIFFLPVLLDAHTNTPQIHKKKTVQDCVFFSFLAHSFIQHILLVCVARTNIYTCEHIHKARLKKQLQFLIKALLIPLCKTQLHECTQ